MDAIQDLLTIAATVVEYFFFSYVAVALLFDAFKRQALESEQSGVARVPSRSVMATSLHAPTAGIASVRSPLPAAT